MIGRVTRSVRASGLVLGMLVPVVLAAAGIVLWAVLTSGNTAPPGLILPNVATPRSVAAIPTLVSRGRSRVAPDSVTPTTPEPIATQDAAAHAMATEDAITGVHNAIQSVVQVRTNDGLGTGFLAERVSGSDLYVTNAHVVGDASTVSVIMADGRDVTGQVTLRNQNLDLAIVAVTPASSTPVLRLASLANLEPGEPIYVVGFALGTELLGDPSVTRGIVSGRRTVNDVNYIQTDAAMNPGNSGGPLLDAHGEVIGVATWGIRDAGGAVIQGINFAIPSDVVQRILAQARI